MRLEATDITAGYGEKDALHAVSLCVETGEFVGLLGPNGSGKSTLLRTLSRTLRPRQGVVRLDGRELTQWTPLEVARRLAFVPQQETAAFDFRVQEVVLMGRYPHRQRFQGTTPADFEIVRQALIQADILPLAERPITHLSGGEYRRVLLARALAQQTPLMLLDEPTAHLDVTHQVALMRLIHALTRQERPIGAFAALHDLNQAAEFCDRLILLREGRVVAFGTPEATLTSENLAIAYDADAHIGSNPMTGRPMIWTLQPVQQAPLKE